MVSILFALFRAHRSGFVSSFFFVCVCVCHDGVYVGYTEDDNNDDNVLGISKALEKKNKALKHEVH